MPAPVRGHRATRRAQDPLRRRDRRAARASRRRPAATSSASTGGSRCPRAAGIVGDRAVQGNLDPVLLLGPWEGVEETRPLDPGPERPAGPATSSTWGTGSCPGPTPTSSRASSTSSTTTERPDDHRRRPADGLRLPRPLDQVEAYYTDIRRGNAARRRTCWRSCWAGTGRSAAARRSSGSWRSSGPPSRRSWPRAGVPRPRVRRHAPHRAADRRHREGHGGGRRRAVRRHRARAAGVVQRRGLQAGRGRRARGHRRRRRDRRPRWST